MKRVSLFASAVAAIMSLAQRKVQAAGRVEDNPANPLLHFQPPSHRSTPLAYGPPPPSYRPRPNQRQRRKALRQARANGF